MDDSPKKFGFVGLIFGTLVCIVIDIAAFFADGFAGVGGFVVQGLSWLVFVAWFHFKGVRGEVQFAKILTRLAVQLIPAIPTYTATFLFVVYQANHPKIAAIAKSTQVMKGVQKPQGVVVPAQKGMRSEFLNEKPKMALKTGGEA
jgi:hypothetical protein